MKTYTSLVLLLLMLLGASPSLLASKSSQNDQGAKDGKSVQSAHDDLDEYAVVSVADPLQPLNRATFWLNHQIYRFLLRPVSKTYDFIVPSPVRRGVYNAFDNLEFPIRVVNDSLQWKLGQAGHETEKFLVNSTAGVGGIMKVSNRIPALADVPSADTAQTFSKWGIGHGFYFVLPLLGPSSLRDTVGLAGDYALNPVSWVTYYYAGAWTLAVTTPDTVRSLHSKLDKYDAVTKNALDPYLEARSAYIQYRKQLESK